MLVAITLRSHVWEEKEEQAPDRWPEGLEKECLSRLLEED